jgi:hypothetical protein
MYRRPCADDVIAFGQPSEWAYEQSEAPEDLDVLYDVLSRFRDAHERHACFTANFVVANPDFQAIAEDGFAHYCETPISTEADLVPKWREGMERRLFCPEYHARRHMWAERWLEDLRSDVPGARRLLQNRCAGGLALIKGQGWRYHSEYLDWQTGEGMPPDILRSHLSESLAVFKSVFGHAPRSTIAPHYIFPDAAVPVWRELGFRYIQGARYRICRDPAGAQRVMSHIPGQHLHGMLCQGRSVKFEPRPTRPMHGLAHGLRAVEQCFANHIPAVLDTHRINYAGPWRDGSLRQLKDLLAGIARHTPLFLTSAELGEAISTGGDFYDIWTREHRRLTPLLPVCRSAARYGLSCMP